MTAYIIPIIFLIVLIIAGLKKKDAYAAFIDGSRSSLNLMVGVLPYLLTIMMAVEVFRASGVAAVIAEFMSPAMNIIGIPSELTELMLIRPLSGAGAISVLENIFTTYGTDTYIGRCASVIYGSSETVFYIATIYFSGCKIKKLGYAIPVALIATIIGCIVGCLLCKYI